MKFNLVYIHSGSSKVPKYLADSIFQTLLVNKGEQVDIHVILQKNELNEFKESLNAIDWELYNLNNCLSANEEWIQHVTVTSIEDLDITEGISLPEHLEKFRDGFWKHTLLRFFILKNFMKFNDCKTFHIENDVMMYQSFHGIYNYMNERVNKKIIWAVKDSPNRVVPSILYFPCFKSSDELSKYILNSLISKGFDNDMNILGSYPNIMSFPIIPHKFSKIIFDGAAIGQYLGGVDPRNLGKDLGCMDVYKNTSGFINETSVFKPNTCNYDRRKVAMNTSEKPINIFVATKGGNSYNIANIHVHSKNLPMFSSINSIEYQSIISGDRVLNLVDFVITTRDIYNFHVNHGMHEISKFVIVNNFSNFNTKLFNEMLRECKSIHVRFFVYTHILKEFQRFILPIIPEDIKITLYVGNSDHEFDGDVFEEILNSEKIIHVYSQNLNALSDKCTLLPIGIANNMWKHGDIISVFKNMLKGYNKKKEKSIYVNINTNTHAYRRKVLDACVKNGLRVISESKPYNEYLEELSLYKFCLCPRGNGLDCHRFWESLYMGVVPVFIDNEHTKSINFVKNLENLDVPFIVVNDLNELVESNFTYKRYKNIIHESGYIGNSRCLKISTYSL